MTRSIELSRDEAELLDDLLLDYVNQHRNRFNPCATQLAAELCAAFGMPPWHERPSMGVSREEWESWTQRRPL